MATFPQNKIYNIPAAGALSAAALHVLLFSSVVLVFQPLSKSTNTDIVFLGAILDPFEVGTTKAKRSLIHGEEVFLPAREQGEGGRAVTAPAKPDMSGRVRYFPKTTMKPQMINESNPSEPSTRNPSKNSIEGSFAPRYQHLKMYPQ